MLLSKRSCPLGCLLMLTVCAAAQPAQTPAPQLPQVEDLGLNPKPYVQRAELYRNDRDFAAAAAYYRRAAEVNPDDPQLRVALGDVLHQLSRVDPSYAGQDRAAWEAVVASNPRRKDAQQRLMNYYLELVQFGAAAQYAAPLHDAAERVLKLDPADKVAQVWTHAAVIAGRLAQTNAQTPAELVEQHLAALRKLWADGLHDANIPFYAARVALKQAIEFRGRGDAASAARAEQSVAEVIERALAESPADAVLRLRAAQLYQDLASLAAGNAAEQQRLLKRVRDVVEQAYKTVRETDPAFTETYIAYAHCLTRDGDAPGAERILRELLAHKPGDQLARITLAQALHARGQYPEASELLRQPITDPVDTSIITYRNRRSVETQTLAELTAYLIDSYPTLTNDVARARLTAEVKQNFEKLAAREGATPLTLKLKGRISLMKGTPADVTEAISALERARQLFEKTYPPSTGYHDWELEYLLAQAYNDAHQTGLAKQRLWEIVGAVPNFVPARVMLARLLLASNETELAGEQVKKIEELAPALPELEKLKTALAAATVVAGTTAATTRPAAAATTTTATTKPVDPALAKQQIQAIKDPFQREFSFYEFYAGQNDRDEAARHLQVAERIAPDHPKLLDLKFNLALTDRDWQAAERLLDRLDKANADEAHGLIYRYRLAFAKGDLNLADSLARDLTISYPQYARSWICHGDALKARRQYVTAIANYKTALEKQSESIEALRGLIECHYAIGQPQEANRYIEAGLKFHPDDQYLREQRVTHDLNFGTAEQIGAALAARAEAARRQPELVAPQLAYGAAEWHVAQLLFRAGKTAEAQPHVQKALDVFTAAKNKWPDERMPYAYLADVAAATNDFAAGEKALQELAARDKWYDSPDPSVLLGDYYARFGRASLMEAAYRAAQVKLEHAKSDSATNEVRRKVAAFFSAQRDYDTALDVLKPGGSDHRIQQQKLEILLAAGRLDQAEQFVDEQITSNSDDAQLWATRGYLLLQQKTNPAEAIEALDKAIALDSHNQTALYYRGTAELRLGPTSLNDAIRDLTAARDAADAPTEGPPNPMAQIQTRIALADALRQRNQNDDAIREMERALQLQPQSKELRMKLIEMLAKLPEPRWERVDQLVEESQRLPGFDRDPDWWRVASAMWITRKDPDKALAAIRKAIQLMQGQPPQRQLSLMQECMDILAKAKRYDELEAECSDILRNPQFAISAWWAYQQRAIARFNLGRKEAAARDFDAALRIAGTSNAKEAPAAILQSIADTLGLDDAIARAEREAAKGDMQARALLPYEYFTKKDYPKALAAADAALADVSKLSDSQKQTVYGVLGSIHMANANFPKARAAYTALLGVDPDDVTTLNNLAVLYADFLQPPDPKKALQYSEHATQVLKQTRRSDPGVLDTYGWSLVLTGSLDAGIERLRLAQGQHETVEVDYHLGAALSRKTDKSAARAELEKALKLVDPNKTSDARLKPKIEKALATLDAVG
jgi:tetratricopeptide (TPR) repeat protein